MDKEIRTGFDKLKTSALDTQERLIQTVNNPLILSKYSDYWNSTQYTFNTVPRFSKALVAWQYLFTNKPRVATYFSCVVDELFQSLTSTLNYTMDVTQIPTFQDGEGFWSLTAYNLPNGDITTTQNFTVGQGVTHPVMIYMSNTLPDNLPVNTLFLQLAEDVNFQLVFRIYNPSTNLLIPSQSPYFPQAVVVASQPI